MISASPHRGPLAKNRMSLPRGRGRLLTHRKNTPHLFFRDIAAAEDEYDFFSGQLFSELQGGGERCSAGGFGGVVGVFEQESNGVLECFVAYQDEVIEPYDRMAHDP